VGREGRGARCLTQTSQTWLSYLDISECSLTGRWGDQLPERNKTTVGFGFESSEDWPRDKAKFTLVLFLYLPTRSQLGAGAWRQ
jgi:hypothetical protein